MNSPRNGSLAGTGRPLFDPVGHLDPEPGTSQRLFTRFGRLLGPLLVGYLFLGKTFAYIHVPGTPAYIGEIVLAVGLLAAFTSFDQLRPLGRDSEMVFVLLAVFCAWGLVLLVSGASVYGIDAARDSALCYYSLFAFLIYSTLARVPSLLDRWARKFGRIVPWLLPWIPIDMILSSNGTSIFIAKPGDASIAALLALGYLWLFPDNRTAKSRAFWSIVALGVIGVEGTQNRGGLIAVAVGVAIGLAYYKDPRRLLKQAMVVIVAGSALASLAPAVKSVSGREFSPAQLIKNVASIGDSDASRTLEGTEEFRKDLWTRILDKQVKDDAIITGMGFGPNLPADVGVYSDATGTFRNPHNSHLDIFARMGAIGIVLWIAFWLSWFWRIITGCRRLATQGLHRRRQVCVLAMMITASILIETFFDPGLEGAQLATLLWTTCGVGVAMTSSRDCFNRFTPPGERSHEVDVPR